MIVFKSLVISQCYTVYSWDTWVLGWSDVYPWFVLCDSESAQAHRIKDYEHALNEYQHNNLLINLSCRHAAKQAGFEHTSSCSFINKSHILEVGLGKIGAFWWYVFALKWLENGCCYWVVSKKLHDIKHLKSSSNKSCFLQCFVLNGHIENYI